VPRLGIKTAAVSAGSGLAQTAAVSVSAVRRQGSPSGHRRRESLVYIGIGTIVLILLILLVIYLVRGRTV
jgi:uncharacterized BrkB/YihY/UPF0761 family membrane protein